MPEARDDHAAAMYFIARIRHALSTINYDSAVFCSIAEAMEQNIPRVAECHRASLETAARWIRHLDGPGPC